MKIRGTRTFLELRVGSGQVVEVTLHVKRAQVTWFNEPPALPHSDNGGSDTNNASETEKRTERETGKQYESHFSELLDLLQTSVLPRMFADEIEATDAAIRHAKRPPNIGPGGIAITVGEKSTSAANPTNTKRKAPKRKMSKKRLAELKRADDEAERERRNKEKEVHYAVSDTLQIAYKLREPSDGATLVFVANKNSAGGDGGDGSTAQSTSQTKFRTLKRLSRSLLVWCYPLDTENHIPSDEGFLRPELIPMAGIFRASREEQRQAG